jgi:streptogramin lyase
MYFLDIVGSTALATELGDARWRELLTRFRRVVRAEVKRFGGREQDTAGDGFFSTFTEPAQALRAAVFIAGAVQELGVDVRGGIHTGEAEEIDGNVGGIAVHVAARVMSLAGPAEVMVTSTVRDLVSGSEATFEDRGLHELKGVEGARHVFALTAVELHVPEPLTPEESAERLAQVVPLRTSRRTRVLLAAAGAILLIAAAVGGVLAFRGGASTEPVDLVQLDAKTRQVVQTVHDTSVDHNPTLWFENGTLWQMKGGHDANLAARDSGTGASRVSIPLGADACNCKIAFGFGSVWVAKRETATSGPHSGTTAWVIERVDQLSGKRLHTFRLPKNADFGAIATGMGATWILEADGTLIRIDPLTNRIAARYRTGALETGILEVVGGYVWICECQFNQVRRFDARTGKAKTFKIAENAFIVPVVAAKITLFDPDNGTITVMDPQTGHEKPPVGLAGQPNAAVVLDGVAWIAAGPVVDRVEVGTGKKAEIAMPKGVFAGGIAADPATHTLWIKNDRTHGKA